MPVQRPGAEGYRGWRRKCQQRPRGQRHARGYNERFAFRQTPPAPQRQKELRRRDGEVIFISILRGLWLPPARAGRFLRTSGHI